ncbi:MAG: glycoside hydrolase family 13 protein [Pirellulales bacterium]
MRKFGQNLLSWAACAALGVASIGCSPAASVTDRNSSDAAPAGNIEPTVASVYTDDAVQPAVHSSVAEPLTKVAAVPVPTWAADAVFYQIFPERFANGDPANDPTRESLEAPDGVPKSWKMSPWTGDWYARDDWERALGPNFFENGVFSRRYGGDLQGVIDRLDYLQNLGINAIYFNPVFYARSLHKYDGNSFHHVDPHFGPDPAGDFALMAKETSDPKTWHWTAADKLFLETLRQAHARGIRVIIDGVFNHTGRDFFAFADLREKQSASPYKDWYIVQSFDDPTTPQSEFRYRGWWGVDTLPEFADGKQGRDLHPGPKQYVFDITTRWMDPDGNGDPSDGIDGWRLDVANEMPTGFWSDWHEHVRRLNPDAYTVAEVWEDASRFLAEGGFTATMNYYGFSFPAKGFLIDNVLTPSEAVLQLTGRRTAYAGPVQQALLNMMDSHDTDRLASMIVNTGRRPYEQPARFDYDIGVSPRYVADYDVRKPTAAERRIQRMAALLQMTYVGAPMIYYGTEAGMWGGDDPCDRMPMVWPEMTYAPQQSDPLGRPRPADIVEFDESLHQYYRAAIELRKQVPSLRRGSIEFLRTDDKARFLAFQRSDADDTVLVGFNRGDADYGWEIPLKAGESVAQAFTASGEVGNFPIEEQAGSAVVTVPACDGVVLELRRKK